MCLYACDNDASEYKHRNRFHLVIEAIELEQVHELDYTTLSTLIQVL